MQFPLQGRRSVNGLFITDQSWRSLAKIGTTDGDNDAAENDGTGNVEGGFAVQIMSSFISNSSAL